MLVTEFMTKPVTTVHQDSSLEEAARLMIDRKIGSLPVVDDKERLVGIITESDFTTHERGVPFTIIEAPQLFGRWVGPEGIEKIYREARATPVREIMNAPVITVSEEATVDEVVRTMMNHDINRVIVVADNKPLGIITHHDLLRLMLR